MAELLARAERLEETPAASVAFAVSELLDGNTGNQTVAAGIPNFTASLTGLLSSSNTVTARRAAWAVSRLQSGEQLLANVLRSRGPKGISVL